MDRDDEDAFLMELRPAMGEEAFALAWEEGLAMTFEEATAHAHEWLEATSTAR